MIDHTMGTMLGVAQIFLPAKERLGEARCRRSYPGELDYMLGFPVGECNNERFGRRPALSWHG